MFTSKQGTKVNRLVKAECTNHFDGDCILLDCNCPLLISGDVLCNYFKNSVLPLDAELEQELSGDLVKKSCKRCYKKFFSKSNRVEYCEFCAKIVAREKGRDRKKLQRSQTPTHVTF